ncbi:N-formylglutamate amidohydrolase [Aquicoccus sp. G2-2]|uniref:N-formylglutamate amidohydrolase n=1 Tax=Aquicoccus sp. G2-2 TaxID=3092120 RepID=UPI002ADF2FA9|nr:N-formylglutamate amidohydrolase [Aquicoccus sp. G2-2]MEA1115298.1 N-formylglutamate amidohydrolase [Aquicoccus sp. G2-2]
MLTEQGIKLETNDRDWWTTHRGASPVLGTAIHNGHEVNPALEDQMALPESDRLREEDPFTEYTIRDLPNRIAFHRSRFAVDLNRARDEAVYLSPEQSWGLDVWEDKPSEEMVEQSLEIHDHYYIMLKSMLRELETQYGHFVVLDIHSYNHRRCGPREPASDPRAMPEINIGTHSMDRDKWAHVVDPFMDKLREFEFRGHKMDVRENVAFKGKGEQTRFIHESFPKTGCAIAVEFKKFFMDEWSGKPDLEALIAMRLMIRSTLKPLEDIIKAMS